MRAWTTWLLFAVLSTGCAYDVGPAPEDSAPYDDEAKIDSKQLELKIGPSNGGRLGSKLGWNPPNCSSCYDQYLDCLDDAGGDAELNDLCEWESDVCYRHCTGPIIAIQ